MIEELRKKLIENENKKIKRLLTYSKFITGLENHNQKEPFKLGQFRSFLYINCTNQTTLLNRVSLKLTLKLTLK